MNSSPEQQHGVVASPEDGDIASVINVTIRKQEVCKFLKRNVIPASRIEWEQLLGDLSGTELKSVCVGS